MTDYGESMRHKIINIAGTVALLGALTLTVSAFWYFLLKQTCEGSL